MEDLSTLPAGAIPGTAKKPRAKKPAKKAVEEKGPSRLGIELSDEITAEIENVLSKSKALQRNKVREIVREKARAAAESAILGNVEDLVKEAIFG